MGTLDDAIEQLRNLQMKRPNLTTAQRREALKANLLKSDESYDLAKWLRGIRKTSGNRDEQSFRLRRES